jgi:ParB family chromosome partitioning protein
MVKPVLGRGLGALLGGTSSATKAPASQATSVVANNAAATPADNRDKVQRVALARVQPSLLQPRKDFSDEALRELADSIREQGIVQPLIVRQKGVNFELIAGERRWRAAQLIGLPEVPVIVREADDRSVLELALIENLQRENLNPLEEALGYSQLIEQFQLTQEQTAAKVGKGRVVVANALRLLKLPAEVRDHIRAGRISVGHAKVVLGLPSAADQKMAAERIVAQGWSVRQTEEFVAHFQKHAAGSPSSKTPGAPATSRDLHVVDIENKLKERFGTKVNLRYRAGKGSIEIRFFSEDELERVLQITGISAD